MLRDYGGIERPIRITSERVALSNSIRAIKGFEFGTDSALWIACGWGAVYRVTYIPEPEFITLNFRVTEDDQPVAGAIVDFSHGGYSAITGTDGIYSINVEL